MTAFVALLRGINVGGNNILPMKDFRELLAGLGCENVATYIQSGNAVFEYDGCSTDLSRLISDAVESGFGFRPSVMVLTASEFAEVGAANPFVEAVSEPKSLHIWFLREVATQADTLRMNEVAADSERFQLTDAAFYLHAPDGIGRSKLAAAVEKLLGVAATARNWRSVSKINDLLEALG